jgi:hypothetical protein
LDDFNNESIDSLNLDLIMKFLSQNYFTTTS